MEDIRARIIQPHRFEKRDIVGMTIIQAVIHAEIEETPTKVLSL